MSTKHTRSKGDSASEKTSHCQRSGRLPRVLAPYGSYTHIVSLAVIIHRELLNIANDPFEANASAAYVDAWRELPPDVASLLRSVRSLVGHAMENANDFHSDSSGDSESRTPGSQSTVSSKRRRSNAKVKSWLLRQAGERLLQSRKRSSSQRKK